MRAMLLRHHSHIEEKPLELVEMPKPKAGKGEILIKVKVCGICHTDLHIIEKEITPSKLPLIPGHQIVGVIDEVGEGVEKRKVGEVVGVPWLYSSCGKCQACLRGMENLCENIKFTGFDVNGGLAEYHLAKEDFVYPIPQNFSFINAAPLLCAGIIGYRALRLSQIKKGEVLGLYGFGSSAHITIQVARYLGSEVYVFTRSKEHQILAKKLGASWVGTADDEPPSLIDSGIIFAPAGSLLPKALKLLRKGGTLALAGIYMDRIPEMPYTLLYGERCLKTVANSTRQDAKELFYYASRIPIKTEVETFPFERTNEALIKLKRSKINGSGVVVIDQS